MSENTPKNTENEEVDLGQLFNAIGKLFSRLVDFIANIFKGIFSILIYLIKPFVVNFKLVILVLIVAAALGFIYEKFEEPTYYSEMIVKPYFDSKYQLSNNVDYFNDLIEAENVQTLSDIFSIDSIEVKSLKKFELVQGPESPNDLFNEYNEYLKTIDTSLVEELPYEQYVKNRNFFAGKVYTIKAWSLNKNVFPKLELGFQKTFINDLSEKVKARRDTVSDIRIQSLEQELIRLDTIQQRYLEVLKNESERSKLSLDFGTTLPVQEATTATREYELFLEEQNIRRALRNLKASLAEENTFYDILSHFDSSGSKDKSFEKNFMYLFPIIAIFGLLIAFFGANVFTFIKNYE